MFKNKIIARSETDIKAYLFLWLDDIRKLGYMNPDMFLASRQAKIAI